MRTRRRPSAAPGISKDVAPGTQPERASGRQGPAVSAGVMKAAREVMPPICAGVPKAARNYGYTYPTLLV